MTLATFSAIIRSRGFWLIRAAAAKNKEDNYKNLEKSILSAAKVFISDYRYDIQLDSTTLCSDSNRTRNINSINLSGSILKLDASKLKISVLVDNGYLTTNDDENDDEKILNPKDDSKHLDLDGSYVEIRYNCTSKDYDFILHDLKWE